MRTRTGKETVGEELDQLRRKIVDRILLITSVLAGILMVLTMLQEYQRGTLASAGGYGLLYVLLLVVTFVRTLPYVFRASVVPFVFFVVGIAELYRYTIVSNAMLYFSGGVLLLGILVGFRAGLIALIVTTLMTMIFAALYLYGGLHADSPEGWLTLTRLEMAGELSNWVNIALPFLFIVGALLAAITAIFRALGASVRASESLVTGLRYEMDERQKAQDELIEARKMESVSQLAGRVAHDLNNFIHVIRGTAELLQDACNEDREEYVQVIVSATERAARLSTQLLAASRQQVLSLEEMDINAFLSGSKPLIKQSIEHDISLVFELGEVGRIRADTGMLEQIILNLCINASDAMEGSGEIVLATRSLTVPDGDGNQDSRFQPGQYVELKVSDTGSGILPEDTDRIFEPFFTTKQLGKGSGLGLASVYNLMEQHGGHIVVNSDPGVKTTFSLYFPELGDTTDTTRSVPDSGQQRAWHELTILVAEDDPDVLQLTLNILTERGVRVYAAKNGHQAIAQIDEHAGEFDLAILDVMMPGRDGREVRAYLGDVAADVPVLFTSGYVQERDGSGSQALKPLVRKPYGKRQLLDAIEKALFPVVA